MKLPKKTREEIERRGGEVPEDDDADRARARIERHYRQRGMPSPFGDAAGESGREPVTDCEPAAETDDDETAPDDDS